MVGGAVIGYIYQGFTRKSLVQETGKATVQHIEAQKECTAPKPEQEEMGSRKPLSGTNSQA
jgi:hypothetical protein